ncbi:hypothetical protein [Alterinioella nitratireducens]|uniref:hypothetical protein n=1 Tax=Alterinioella nitratireducens TaxID=2735915 RepID=UPI00405868AC
MSDSRKIAGSVKVEQKPDAAQVAYQMAASLWWAEFGTDPKASDGKFLDLVRYCSKAAQGEALFKGTYAEKIAETFR